MADKSSSPQLKNWIYISSCNYWDTSHNAQSSGSVNPISHEVSDWGGILNHHSLSYHNSTSTIKTKTKSKLKSYHRSLQHHPVTYPIWRPEQGPWKKDNLDSSDFKIYNN